MRWKTLAAALGLLGVLILSACGTTTTNALGGGAPAPTATSTSASTGSSALISTHTASVKGTSEMVLSTGQGMTLYYRTDDTSTTVHCTGGGSGYGSCTDIWPPLVSPNGAAPTSDTTLPGGLSLLNDSNGQQVMYNGHPLYTYSGDQAPGDATGEGIQGIWHVVTPSLAASGAAPSGGSPTPTPTGGGYGGGYP